MGRAAWLAFAICAAGVLTACSSGGGTQPSASVGNNSVKAGKAPLCAQGTTLPFDYKKAANIKDADGTAIGADGAKSLVGELGDSDSVCGLAVSPETQKVIDDAHALVQQGKKIAALALIDAETTRVIALPTAGTPRHGTRGMALAATPAVDQKVRGLLGLGGAAQDAGDDGGRQLAEAQAAYGPALEERLKSADWQDATRIAAEAEKLGMDDLQKRAQDKVKSEVRKMADEARKSFDACIGTDAQLKKLVTLLALAQMTLDGSDPAIQTIESVLSDTAAAATQTHTNQLPPECARWTIKVSDVLTFSGDEATWTLTAKWNGTFLVGKTGRVEGDGGGLWTFDGGFCNDGHLVVIKPSSGVMKATIGGELKDDKQFHLLPDQTATVTGGCTEDPNVQTEIVGLLGLSVAMFEEKTGEAAYVIAAEDGATAHAEASDSGITYSVTVTLTKRPVSGG